MAVSFTAHRRRTGPASEAEREALAAPTRPPGAMLAPGDALRLQRGAGNAAAARLLGRREDAPDGDAAGAAPARPDAVVIWFPRDSAEPRQDRAVDGKALLERAAGAVQGHVKRRPGSRVVIAGYASVEGPPERNQRLSEARAAKVKALLVAAGAPADVLGDVGRGVSTSWPGREWNRRVDVEVPLDSAEEDEPGTAARPFSPRGYTRTEGTAASRLESLALVARREGAAGAQFAQAVTDFKAVLGARVMAVNAGDPLPPDLAVVLRALVLWSRDTGTTWGEGIWYSRDVTLTAADYATIPASQNKCNSYVAEVLHGAVGTVHKAHESAQQPGRFFPYRAGQWGDANQHIPNYPVVTDPRLGDVWSNGSHMGVYLGSYSGRLLYISARDDGSGVFALDKIQHAHGIQIKFMPAGGVYRRFAR
jgi:outer membrane protein OmpA-like peptidoglycan-associated protein